MTQTSTIQMACRGSVSDGRARCRNMVDGVGICSIHKESKLADPPTVILFKTRVNQNWTRKLEAAGVRWQARNDAGLAAEHAAEAEKLRRKANAIRSTADSGSPVFGEKGAQNVILAPTFMELDKVGFILTDIHMYVRENEGNGMANFVIELRNDGRKPPVEDAKVLWTWPALSDLISSNWGFVHVWANPRKEDGAIPHTINASHRQPDRKPAHTLVYDQGYWNLTPV